MSWGERSCLKPCRCPETVSMPTCNVDCPGYKWDGVEKPDSVPHPNENMVGQSTSTNTPVTQGLKPNRAQRRKAARLRNR